MPVTPTLVLCDDLVAALVAAWNPVAPDGAEREYFKRVGDPGNAEAKLTGRQAYVFPTRYAFEPQQQGEDGITHEVSVLVVERYTDAGDPPKEWTDERVDFVYQQIVQGFNYSRTRPSWNRKLVRHSADVEVCDVQKLATGGKLFYSLVNLVFEETTDA